MGIYELVEVLLCSWTPEEGSDIAWGHYDGVCEG